MKPQAEGTRVWVTGASTGIGRACAFEFARRGARVALSARSGGALTELAAVIGAGRSLALPLDVADRDANRAAVARIENEWGGLDMVLLNAGSCEYVDGARIDADLFERQMRTNFMSVVYGVEAALPALRRSPAPHLAAVSSAAAYGALPRAEAYGASKAAVAYFLESLRIDLLKERIPVSVVFPGFVRTPLTDKNDFPMPFRIEAEHAARIIASRLVNQPQRSHQIHFPIVFALLLKALAGLPSFLRAPLLARLTERK